MAQGISFLDLGGPDTFLKLRRANNRFEYSGVFYSVGWCGILLRYFYNLNGPIISSPKAGRHGILALSASLPTTRVHGCTKSSSSFSFLLVWVSHFNFNETRHDAVTELISILSQRFKSDCMFLATFVSCGTTEFVRVITVVAMFCSPDLIYDVRLCDIGGEFPHFRDDDRRSSLTQPKGFGCTVAESYASAASS